MNTAAQIHKKLVGRTFVVNQGDLNPGDDKHAIRNFKFMIEKVNGNDAIGYFHGMKMTTDKQKEMVKRRHTLIESVTDASTSDGYLLRFLICAVTKKDPESLKKTAYANKNTKKEVRRVINSIVSETIEGKDIISAMKKFCSEEIGMSVISRCDGFCPLQVCYTVKVNVLKRPKVN